MKTTMSLSADGKTLTVTIPMRFKRQGGRKLIILPEGNPSLTPHPRVNSAMVAALARAHRWQRMMEAGEVASIAELARAERVSPSYVHRLMRLTLLAPDIIETILDGRQPKALSLNDLLKPLPMIWDEQRRILLKRGDSSSPAPA
jgi:hypothetical protein